MRFFKACLVFLMLGLSSPWVMADKININEVDAETLDAALDGIGPKKAEAIVKYREDNGPFKTIEDLTEVSGIGEKTLEKNRDKITVGASTEPSEKAAATEKSKTTTTDNSDNSEAENTDKSAPTETPDKAAATKPAF